MSLGCPQPSEVVNRVEPLTELGDLILPKPIIDTHDSDFKLLFNPTLDLTKVKYPHSITHPPTLPQAQQSPSFTLELPHIMNYQGSMIHPHLPFLQFPFPKPEHERRRQALVATKKVIPSLRPHEKSTSLLNIDNGDHHVYEVFHSCGLDVEELMSYETYDDLVIDFFSSFEVVKEGDTVVGWSFVFQGIECRLSKEQVIYHLRLPSSGSVPSYTSGQRRAFWRSISKDPTGRTRSSPQEIKEVYWRYIHQLVAVNINSRRGKGKVVTNEDLDLMQLLSKKAPIDMFTIYTKNFEEMSDPGKVNKGLGCSSVISVLARACRFFLKPENGKSKRLCIPRLVKWHIIDPDWDRIYIINSRFDSEGEELSD